MTGNRPKGLFWAAVFLAALTYIHNVINTPGHAFRHGSGVIAVTEKMLEKSQERVGDIYAAQAHPLAENDAHLADLRNQLTNLARENTRLKERLAALRISARSSSPATSHVGNISATSKSPTGQSGNRSTLSPVNRQHPVAQPVAKNKSDAAAYRAGLHGTGQVYVRYVPLP